MSDVRDRLRRLTKSRDRAVPIESAAETVSEAASRTSESNEWAGIDAEIYEIGGGSFIRRRRHYKANYQHGRYALGRLWHGCEPLSALSSNGEQSSADQLLFLDTETTGLGVGAGNVPFMIGYGYLEADRYTVEQLFIRNPSEEYHALLYLQDMMSRFHHVVSYNGRTFDWPVLKNRFVLHRLSLPREPGHIDFLYPSRSLWKRSLPSCRLSIVEEKKLGYKRGEDLPGSEAPARYMQYLASSRIEDVYDVFLHNERDIVSLAALAIHFQELLHGVAREDSDTLPEDGVRWAWWLDRLGLIPTAQEVLARTLQDESSVKLSRKQLMDAAALYKRWHMYDQAAALWRRSADVKSNNTLQLLDPLVELAVYHEHRLRDPDGALQWALRARAVVERRISIHRGSASDRFMLNQIDHRLERLRRKIDKPRQQYLNFH